MRCFFVRSRLSAAALALVACLSSCAGTPPLDQDWDAPAPRVPLDVVRLGAGDAIEVEYFRSPSPPQAYQLQPGDRLRIEISALPELDSSPIIAPDGSVSVARIGTLPAAGSTVAELQAALRTALENQFPDPQVTVYLESADSGTERFLETLLSHPQGGLRTVTLNQDGRVSLPGIGEVRLLGTEPAEAEALLNERLQASFPNLAVALNASRLAGATYSVLGEVNAPGRYPLNAPTTLVEALATAGGETEYGDLEKVVLIEHPAAAGEPAVAHLYDLDSALEHGDPLAGIELRPRDTVLVLRRGIGDVNEAIEHYIRRNIPLAFTFGYRIE